MQSELFADSARIELFTTYKKRCGICLLELPLEDDHYEQEMDEDCFGIKYVYRGLAPVEVLRPTQVNMGIELGLIEEGYMGSSPHNGMMQCPTCYLSFFTPRHVVLSPAKEVLLWYKNYLLATLNTNRKPLYEITSMLSSFWFDGLPDVKPMLPFLSLSSVIVLDLTEEDRYRILTCSQPNLSILGPNGPKLAPPGTSPGDPNVARIFDVAALPCSPLPFVPGQIPLSPSNPEFAHRRLWRLPIALPVILTALLYSISDLCTSEVEEIRLALEIRTLLQISKLGLSLPGSSNRGTPGDGSSG